MRQIPEYPENLEVENIIKKIFIVKVKNGKFSNNHLKIFLRLRRAFLTIVTSTLKCLCSTFRRSIEGLTV